MSAVSLWASLDLNQTEFQIIIVFSVGVSAGSTESGAAPIATMAIMAAASSPP